MQIIPPGNGLLRNESAAPPARSIITITATGMFYRMVTHSFHFPTRMYIVVIAWIYVVFMMSITETSPVAGVMTFVFYGLLPTGIIVWLAGTGKRRQRRKAREAALREAAATRKEKDE